MNDLFSLAGKNILITLIEIAKNLLSSATINANSQPIAFTNSQINATATSISIIVIFSLS